MRQHFYERIIFSMQGQAFEEDGISKLPVQMQYSEYVTEDPFLVPKKVMVDFAARLKLDGLVLTCQNSWERSGEVILRASISCDITCNICS